MSIVTTGVSYDPISQMKAARRWAGGEKSILRNHYALCDSDATVELSQRTPMQDADILRCVITGDGDALMFFILRV